jgi:uncharacterized protein (TIGR02001 family)
VPFSEAISSVQIAEQAVIPASAPTLRADGYLSLGSQYVYRGVAVRDSGPVVSGEVALSQLQGWFVDAWLGRVESGHYYETSVSPEWQLDLMAGYADQIGSSWQWSLARAWIDGVDNSFSESKNYQEWRANIFYRDQLSAQLAYTEDYRQQGWPAWNAELKYLLPLTREINGEIGWGRSHGAGSARNYYNYGWLGIEGNCFSTEWNLRWIDTSKNAEFVINSSRAGGRVELVLTWPFNIF